MTPDISRFAYGLLSLSNPSVWPNQPECPEFSNLITGKSVYVWPLVFASYIWHLEDRKGTDFPSELKKIDNYLGRHLGNFAQANPVDFSNSGSQYVKSKPGSFQAIRKDFGAPAKKLKISEAERLLTEELSDLEDRGLIVDPFTITAAGVTMAVLGAVPFSFTQRTDEGDEKYIQIRAMLWEYEKLSKGEKQEVKDFRLMPEASFVGM